MAQLPLEARVLPNILKSDRNKIAQTLRLIHRRSSVQLRVLPQLVQRGLTNSEPTEGPKCSSCRTLPQKAYGAVHIYAYPEWITRKSLISHTRHIAKLSSVQHGHREAWSAVFAQHIPSAFSDGRVCDTTTPVQAARLVSLHDHS